jgi:hypothetical protein
VEEVADDSQVIEKMERETGVEPATSSLGKGTSFANKEHRVLVIFVPAIEDNGFRVRFSREA